MTDAPQSRSADKAWLRQFEYLKLAAENFRRAMIQSGATSHVKQSLYMEQLRALECALNPLNYRGGYEDRHPNDMVLHPLAEIREWDEALAVLGIQDSDQTPAEAIRELNAEIERLCGVAQAAPRCGKLSDDQIMDILRKVTKGQLYDLLTCKRWKDGIDIDSPTFAAQWLALEFCNANTVSDRAPAYTSTLVDEIANIISDYYDEDDAGRWRKCAEHIAQDIGGIAYASGKPERYWEGMYTDLLKRVDAGSFPPLWQTMETAPRNKFIFLFCPEDRSRWLAKWQDGRWHGVDDLGLSRSGASLGDPDVVTGWFVSHWQPLPVRPTSQVTSTPLSPGES